MNDLFCSPFRMLFLANRRHFWAFLWTCFDYQTTTARTWPKANMAKSAQCIWKQDNLKKRLQDRRFLVNIGKFLRTVFFIEHLRRLLDSLDLFCEKQPIAPEEGHKCFELNPLHILFLFEAKRSVVMSPHFFVINLKVKLFTIQSSWPITLVRKSPPWFFSLLIQVGFRFIFFILQKLLKIVKFQKLQLL